MYNKQGQYLLEQMVSTGEFKEFVPEVVNEAILTYYEPALLGRTATNVFTAESPIISWLDERGLDAAIVGEGEEPPRARMRFSKRTLRMLKIGLALEFTAEVIEDAALNLVAKHVQRATVACARKENAYIFSVLLGGVADGSSTFMKGEIYADHILEATDTSWNPTNTDLDYTKIQVATQTLEDEGWNPDTVVMSPAQWTQVQLLLDTRDSSGLWNVLTPRAESAIDSGRAVVRGLDRFNVIVTPAIPNNKFLMFDKAEYSAFYERRPLGVNTIPDDLRDMMTMSMFERVGCAVIKPAAAVMINGLSYSNPADYVTAV